MNRFSLSSSKEQILHRFQGYKIRDKYIVNYNIGASDPAYIICNENKELIQPALWGMKSESGIQHPFLTIDYRNVHVSPSFRLPFRLNRCLIVADGFYVWNMNDKQPYFVCSKEKPILTFPGIYNTVSLNQESCVMCFAVICRLNFKNTPPTLFDYPISFSSEDDEKWLSDLSVLEAVDLLNKSQNEEWFPSRVSNKILIKGFNRPEVKKLLQPLPSLFN